MYAECRGIFEVACQETGLILDLRYSDSDFSAFHRMPMAYARSLRIVFFGHSGTENAIEVDTRSGAWSHHATNSEQDDTARQIGEILQRSAAASDPHQPLRDLVHYLHSFQWRYNR